MGNCNQVVKKKEKDLLLRTLKMISAFRQTLEECQRLLNQEIKEYHAKLFKLSRPPIDDAD